MQNRQPLSTSSPGVPCPQTDSNSPYSTALRSSPVALAAQAALNERLHLATRQGDVQVVSALLDQGADVGSESADDPEVAGFSPLEVAALKGNEEVCRLLLSRGADPNQDQHLPLAIAASEGHEAVCRLLLARGAAINAEMGPGFSALICAVERGRTLVVRFLLEQGANPNASREFLPDTFSPSVHSPDVHSPGTNSPGTNSPGILTSGNLPAGMERKMSCLMIAALSGHTDICRLLLSSGAALEARGPYGLTPLAFAAHYGRKEACQVLLAAGADPNTADAAGDTPLLSAASEGHTDVCELLLESGAAIDARHSVVTGAVAMGLARKDTNLLALLVMHQPDFADLEAILEGRPPNAEPNTFPTNTSSKNNSSHPSSSFAFCSRCGSSLPDGSGTPGGASFCPTCGHALPAPSAPAPSAPVSSAPVSSYGSSSYGSSAPGSAPRVSLFPPQASSPLKASSPLSGGLSSGNYSHVFVQFEAAGAKEGKSAKWMPTFNWSAFLLGPVWYLLKGMWVKALLFTVVSLLLVGVTGGLSALAAWLYYGLFGNWDLYLWEKHGKQGW